MSHSAETQLQTEDLPKGSSHIWFFSFFLPSLSGASVATSSLLTSTPTPLWVPVSWWYCKHDIQQWTHGYVIHRPHGRHHLLISGCRRERSSVACVWGGWKKNKKLHKTCQIYGKNKPRAGEVINGRERDFFFFFLILCIPRRRDTYFYWSSNQKETKILFVFLSGCHCCYVFFPSTLS